MISAKDELKLFKKVINECEPTVNDLHEPLWKLTTK